MNILNFRETIEKTNTEVTFREMLEKRNMSKDELAYMAKLDRHMLKMVYEVNNLNKFLTTETKEEIYTALGYTTQGLIIIDKNPKDISEGDLTNEYDLLKYLEVSIKPLYKFNDLGHDKTHLYNVINNCLNIINAYNKQEKQSPITSRQKLMIITACYYHDCMLRLGRKEHHINAYNKVIGDNMLSSFFNKDEINIIATIVKEHRTRIDKTMIESKILSDADKLDGVANTERMIYRCINTTSCLNDIMSKEHYEKSYNHLKSKYGKNGTVNLNLQVCKDIYASDIDTMQQVLENEESFKKIYNNLMEQFINTLYVIPNFYKR